MSVIRTARQKGRDPIELMADTLTPRTPAAATKLTIPTARSDPALAA